MVELVWRRMTSVGDDACRNRKLVIGQSIHAENKPLTLSLVSYSYDLGKL